MKPFWLFNLFMLRCLILSAHMALTNDKHGVVRCNYAHNFNGAGCMPLTGQHIQRQIICLKPVRSGFLAQPTQCGDLSLQFN